MHIVTLQVVFIHYILTAVLLRYCGRILGENLAQLTILAGTVFGNILIWAASSSPKDKRLFHRLSGHNVNSNTNFC